MDKKRIALLGSTGSIGKNALKVIAHLSHQMEVIALAAHSNIELLYEQVQIFQPKLIAVYDSKKAKELKEVLRGIPILPGKEGVNAVATHEDADFVISAIVGSAGIEPTLKAIEAKKKVGLANKEALVVAGDLMMKRAKTNNVDIIPIDSEHSALFQCLKGEKKQEVKRLILTASGGPFRNYSKEKLLKVTPKLALNHPNWKMGKKVSIDCSTLMNKGLEVIEAKYLFDMPLDQIDIIMHPQSIIHSMVEFIDGSLLAQMGIHEMTVPIQYALTYPKRKKGFEPSFDFLKYSCLEFEPVNHKAFPCLQLAYEAIQAGGSLPCYMNAVNEVLVERFLKEDITYLEIGTKLEKLMRKHAIIPLNDLETLFAIDHMGRKEGVEI